MDYISKRVGQRRFWMFSGPWRLNGPPLIISEGFDKVLTLPACSFAWATIISDAEECSFTRHIYKQSPGVTDALSGSVLLLEGHNRLLLISHDNTLHKRYKECVIVRESFKKPFHDHKVSYQVGTDDKRIVKRNEIDISKLYALAIRSACKDSSPADTNILQ